MELKLNSTLSPEVEMVAGEIIASALAVHRELGPGYLESFYRKAVCIELRSRTLAFETERLSTCATGAKCSGLTESI